MGNTWATAAAFFAAKVPREKVTVPGIGEIWVYGLTSQEKDLYEDAVVNFNRGSREMRMSNARETLLMLSVRNQHGHRLFSEKDMGRLHLIPAQIIEPILDVARKLSAMTTGEMENLVKNSQTLQELLSDDSNSDLPDISDKSDPSSPAESAPVS